MAHKKMGEILVEMAVITQETLDQALALQKSAKKRIGQILEDMDVVLEEDIATALSKQFSFPQVKGISRYRFPQDVLELIDAELALSKFVFPLKVDGKTLHLAMSNPLDIDLQTNLSFKINLRIAPCVTTSTEIKEAVKKHYLHDLEADEDERQWSILLADHQPLALSAIEAALKKEGFTIHKATNGAEALKLALQYRPQLILTDMGMPRMDGAELFQRLQTNQGLTDIPVIALSSKATPEEEYRILELGFHDFIAKPVNPLRLVARVKRAMRLIQDSRSTATSRVS